MRTNRTLVFAYVVFLAAFATGCSTGNAEAGRDSNKDQARLEIEGSPGGEFSGSCDIGDEEAEEISGEVPKSFKYDLEGRPLDCEISSASDLRVELTVGEGTHALQSIGGGGTLNLTYEDGSISSVTSSSSKSSSQERSSSSEVTSPAGKSGQGSTNVTKESRDVTGFEEVELMGVGRLSIEQTGSESLSVEAQEDVLPKLKTEVVDNRLIIGPKPDTAIHTTEPVNYELTVKNLNALEVSGSANVEAEGVSTDSLAVTISGTGNVKTGGEADKQEVSISGAGDYRAGELESKAVEIDVGGAGSAIVNASENLNARISGVGSVEYIGDPTVEQDVSGVGRVARH